MSTSRDRVRQALSHQGSDRILAMDAATTPICATASKSRTLLSTKTVISNSIKI